MVIIEQQQAFPGQGVSSTFKLGYPARDNGITGAQEDLLSGIRDPVSARI
jgi:hypothetical protein